MTIVQLQIIGVVPSPEWPEMMTKEDWKELSAQLDRLFPWIKLDLPKFE